MIYFSSKLEDYNLAGLDQSWNDSFVSPVDIEDSCDYSFPPADVNDSGENNYPVDMADSGDDPPAEGGEDHAIDSDCVPMTQLDGPTGRKSKFFGILTYYYYLSLIYRYYHLSQLLLITYLSLLLLITYHYYYLSLLFIITIITYHYYYLSLIYHYYYLSLTYHYY